MPIKIPVKRHHIENGVQGEPHDCPIALALQEAIQKSEIGSSLHRPFEREIYEVSVNRTYLNLFGWNCNRGEDDDLELKFNQAATEFTEQFDKGEKVPEGTLILFPRRKPRPMAEFRPSRKSPKYGLDPTPDDTQPEEQPTSRTDEK